MCVHVFETETDWRSWHGETFWSNKMFGNKVACNATSTLMKF